METREGFDLEDQGGLEEISEADELAEKEARERADILRYHFWKSGAGAFGGTTAKDLFGSEEAREHIQNMESKKGSMEKEDYYKFINDTLKILAGRELETLEKCPSEAGMNIEQCSEYFFDLGEALAEKGSPLSYSDFLARDLDEKGAVTKIKSAILKSANEM